MVTAASAPFADVSPNAVPAHACSSELDDDTALERLLFPVHEPAVCPDRDRFDI